MKVYLRNEHTPAFRAQKLPNGDFVVTGPCAVDHSGDLPDMNSKEHLVYLGISKERIEELESVGAFDEGYDSEPHADELYSIKADLLRLKYQDASAQLEACRFYLESSLIESIQILYNEHNVFNIPMAQLIMEVLEGRHQTLEHLWRLVSCRAEDQPTATAEPSSDRPSSLPADPVSTSSESSRESVPRSETSVSTAATSLGVHANQTSHLELIPEIETLTSQMSSEAKPLNVVQSNSSVSKPSLTAHSQLDRDTAGSADQNRVFLDTSVAQQHKDSEVSSVFKGGDASFLQAYFQPSRVVLAIGRESSHDAFAISSTGNHDLSCGLAPVVYTTLSREHAQYWSLNRWKNTRREPHLGAAILEIELTRELDSQIHRALEPSDDWKRYCLSNRMGEFRLASRCALSAHPLLHTLCSKDPRSYSSWSLDDWKDVKPQLDRAGVSQTQLKIEMPHYEILERCDAHLWWLTNADVGTFAKNLDP